MTLNDTDAFLGATEIPRDLYGRPLILQPGGKSKAYRRVTTFVGVLEDTYNLSLWSQRMVALGLAARPDLLLAAGAASAEDKHDLNKICDAAREHAGASSSATLGTALHKICERVDRGEKLQIPAAAKADVAAYQRATKHLRWGAIERLMVHDELQLAGTPDRLAHVDGRLVVADLKTGSLEYGLPKIAMQLAVYAHSQAYDPDTGERTSLDIDLERATVIHVPVGKGTCELIDVDIAAGWEGVLLARQVWAWRARKDFVLAAPEAVQEAAPQPESDLAVQVATAPSLEALRALWAAHQDVWDEELTALATSRKANLAA